MKKLAARSRSTTGDGMGAIPDLVLLQEVARVDARAIAQKLTSRFSGANRTHSFKVAKAFEDAITPTNTEDYSDHRLAWALVGG